MIWNLDVNFFEKRHSKIRPETNNLTVLGWIVILAVVLF